MRYKAVENRLFVRNRERLKKLMPQGALLVLNSNDQFPRNGDQYHPFRQNSDLFWASGLDQEKTIVILFPDCPVAKYRECAFILKSNEQIAVWEGYKYTKEDAAEVSGIKNIFWMDEFETCIHEMMMFATVVYLNRNENPRFRTEVEYRDVRFTKWITEQYPLHAYERLAPLMTDMRLIKSEDELSLIKEACRITGVAFHRVLGNLRSGMMEYEIQAEMDYVFTLLRANGHAYNPIVASGKNALCLHYTVNNSECLDGDLLLLDFGAEYANYAADLSRTIPVNGKFSARQKECYKAVLRVFKEAKSFIKTGISIDQINVRVNKLMEKEMIALGLFTEADVINQDPDNPLYMKYYMHGTSHFLGMDVHDVGTKQTPLEAGMVITCEPGLYIPEENMGIRIETDLLITEEGNDDLMDYLPVEVEDIERMMKGGL